MTRPTFVVHCIDDCRAVLRAAVETGTPVTVRSAPGAAAYLGAPAFRAMIETAHGECPGADVRVVLDCGDEPGLALAAVRGGLDRVRVDLAADVRARVADIAAQCGAELDDDPAPALDLGTEADPPSACRTWLTNTAERTAGPSG